VVLALVQLELAETMAPLVIVLLGLGALPSRTAIARSAVSPRACPSMSSMAKDSLMNMGVPLADTPRQQVRRRRLICTCASEAPAFHCGSEGSSLRVAHYARRPDHASSPHAPARIAPIVVLLGEQSVISELVLQLEKSNPTAAPARSDKLDGTWAVKFPAFFGPGIIDSPTREIALLLYTGGLKPGLLLQLLDKLPSFVAGSCTVDQLTVTFSGAASGSPMAEGVMTGSIFSNPITFTLRSALAAETDTRLRETYVEASFLDRTVSARTLACALLCMRVCPALCPALLRRMWRPAFSTEP
jgi:hypothetical protein